MPPHVQKGRVLAQDGVVSKNTNELKSGSPERFGLEVSSPLYQNKLDKAELAETLLSA